MPARKPAPRKATEKPTLGTEAIRDAILATIESDKGEEIVVIPLIGRSALADYMIIASGRSTRQVASMADHLREAVQKLGLKTPKIEGKADANWVVVDTGDVIVHLFRPEVRTFYNLEKMWLADAEGVSPPSS